MAEELHFTRAARRLHLSQPPLSRCIKELETEIGTPLFQRTRRSVALTEAGRIYQQRVQSIFIQLEQAKQEAQRTARGESGTLTVGFLGALTYEFLPAILRNYRARRPDVHLTLRDLTPAEQIEAVANGRIDVGFVGLLPEHAGDDITHRILRRDRMLAAIPEGHKLTARKTIQLKDLAEEPWVLIDRRISPDYDRFIRRLCAGAGFTPHVEHEAARAQAMLGLVAAGLGVTIVPEIITRLRAPGVTLVPLKEKLFYNHAVIWRTKSTSPLVAPFLESLAKFG